MKKISLIVLIAVCLFTLSSCCVPTPHGVICFGFIPIPIPGAEATGPDTGVNTLDVVIANCGCSG